MMTIPQEWERDHALVVLRDIAQELPHLDGRDLERRLRHLTPAQRQLILRSFVEVARVAMHPE